MSGGSSKLENVLIHSNVAGSFGGGIYCGSPHITMTNVTITDNTSNAVGGGIYFSYQNFGDLDERPIITNSIIWHNYPQELNSYDPVGNFEGSFEIGYSNIENGQDSIIVEGSSGPVWGSGNIDINPMFVDTANGNYHLLASSMLINAGHPDSTDSDGTRADIGAHPYLNTYSGPIWVVEESGGNDINGTGAEDNKFASIQAAINFASDGDSVSVWPGTYYENINFRGRNIKVVGYEWTTGQNPVIDGGANGSVVTFNSGENNNAFLSEFIIQNGAGIDYENNGSISGGGIFILQASPTLSNLFFR